MQNKIVDFWRFCKQRGRLPSKRLMHSDLAVFAKTMFDGLTPWQEEELRRLMGHKSDAARERQQDREGGR